MQIKPYQDKEYEYLEVAVLQVNLRQVKKQPRIAEVVRRAIPYPLVLVFGRLEFAEKGTAQALSNLFALSLASKRFSRADKEVIVADQFWNTPWINLENPSRIEQDFLSSLNFFSLPHENFYNLYQAFIHRIVALECSKLTGTFRLETDRQQWQKRQKNLAESLELEKRIKGLQRDLKKEEQFNRKVELNVQIKDLEYRLQEKIKQI